MKYLKSFQKLNESLLDDILKGKICQQIDDIDFDEIRIELADTVGREEFTESDKRKVRSLVNKYLCQDKTPFEIKSIHSFGTRVLGETIDNLIQLHIKTGDIDYGCFIDVYKYSDDYFVLNLVIPIARYTTVTDSKSFIAKEEEWYLIDGWDGFDEWATKTTPYNKKTELFELFTIPLNDYNSKEIISQSFKNTILMKYLTIRDWSSKRVYCFDNGYHFGTILHIGRADYFLGDGSLQSDGSRNI
jgi:hypothetical protein